MTAAVQTKSMIGNLMNTQSLILGILNFGDATGYE